LGKSVIDAIICERTKNGDYLSLQDFCERLKDKGVGKKAIESLIKCGAFDCFEYNRRQMTENYERIMDSLNNPAAAVVEGQLDLFEDGKTLKTLEIKIESAPEYVRGKLLEMEKEILGMYLSGHPLRDFEPYAKARKARTVSESLSGGPPSSAHNPAGGSAELKEGDEISLICAVQSVKPHTTKTGGKMLFLRLEDMTGEVEGLVFPELCALAGNLFRKGALLFLTAKLSYKDEEPKLLLETVTDADEFKTACERMDIYVKCRGGDRELRENILETARKTEHSGSSRLLFYFYDINKRVSAKNVNVKVSARLLDALTDIAGAENVALA
jgi:DNA polymerase-3 subunit alpha